jgi:hypothetical protein
MSPTVPGVHWVDAELMEMFAQVPVSVLPVLSPSLTITLEGKLIFFLNVIQMLFHPSRNKCLSQRLFLLHKKIFKIIFMTSENCFSK